MEKTLSVFEEATGLKINYDKTCVYHLGSLQNLDAKLYTSKPFKWTNDTIKILGIDIDHDNGIMRKKNFESVLKKVNNVCQIWANRSLTLMGKTLIINSLCASLFVHKLMVLPTLPSTIAVNFNTIIKSFLWNGGHSKIALSKLCNARELGGLRLVDIVAKDIALKTQWVAILQDNEKVRALATEFLPAIGHDIWYCNISPKDVVFIMEDSFWRDVLSAWSEINFFTPTNVSQIIAQSLWFNSFVKIAGKPVYFHRAHRAGIRFLYNSWDPVANSFLKYEQILDIYGLTVLSYLQYYGLINAIPRHWIREIKNARNILEDFEYRFDSHQGKMTSLVHSGIVSNKCVMSKVAEKWNSKLGYIIPYQAFLECFERLYRLVPSIKLRNFQFRYLHRIIFCAKQLHAWKLVSSPRCYFCEDEYETMEHMFYYCPVTNQFWETFVAWYESRMNTEIVLTLETVSLCNHKSQVLNTLLIMAKQFTVNRKSLQKVLNIHVFREIAMKTIDFEREIAHKDKNYKRFVKKWKNLF